MVIAKQGTMVKQGRIVGQGEMKSGIQGIEFVQMRR
jgi:hypothetical protein